MTEPYPEMERIELIFNDGHSESFYVLKLWRGNILVFTPAELERARIKGKWYRRRQTEAARAKKETNYGTD